MKQEIMRIFNAEEQDQAVSRLLEMPADGSVEMVLRNAQVSKTLQQLGGHFGVWIKAIAEHTGEDEDYIHKMLKAKFLARIYVMMPIGDEQEQWVELLAHYQEAQMQMALKKHAKRISLSWSTIQQMSEYMEAVNNYYANNGLILPILEKKK